jgi:hypothetical protein
MKRAVHSGLAIASCVALGLTGFAGLGTAQAAPALQSANGQGTLDDGARHFAFNDNSCMTVTGNVATFGGTVKRTNDSNLVDAFYFRVADFGEPGAGKDQISRVAFYDDDPSTEGDPALCLNEDTANYTPLEPIESGNIQVRPVG